MALACAAALFFGTWAHVANEGAGAGWTPALTQAGMSFSTTLGMAYVLEALFRLAPSPDRGMVLAAGGTTLIGALGLALVHGVAGTPHIGLTIAPSVVAGTIVYTAYAWQLRVEAMADAEASNGDG